MPISVPKTVAAHATVEVMQLIERLVDDEYLGASRFSVASAAILYGLRAFAADPALITPYLPTERTRRKVRVRPVIRAVQLPLATSGLDQKRRRIARPIGDPESEDNRSKSGRPQ